MSERIGAFICGCGGNISDFVDVEKVREVIEQEPDVVVVRTAMFTCSDATQQDIIDLIKEERLDGIVVASCSPKLHTATFRAMARRAELNQYVYNQVNIREQCSWTHTHDEPSATDKAIRLIRAGISKTRLSHPLDPIRIETVPRVLVVGAGVTGLRSAISLADLGLEVHLVEREAEVGGQIASWGPLFPSDRSGTELIQSLVEQVKARDQIHLYTSAQVVKKEGSVGNFGVIVACDGSPPVQLMVGSIIVATGFDRTTPGDGEFGYGLPGVVTLDGFRTMLDESTNGSIEYDGKPVKDVAYIYCVGSRQPPGEGAHTYCSRYCCTAAVHTALQAGGREQAPRQFHLYRDVRTYGKSELLYNQVLEQGSVFLKYPDEEPPEVSAENGRLKVTVKDQLTGGEEITLRPDLVVLVTGMQACANDELVDTLKLPVGLDGFYNEIHPKLRPVETVMDGIMIAGACQGPKNVPESAASAMAAAAKTGGLLMKGVLDLEPFVAVVDVDKCEWCGACAEACPYGAIGETKVDGKGVAEVNLAICKGCGACVPVCEPAAIAVEGYTHNQVTEMINALAREVA